MGSLLSTQDFSQELGDLWRSWVLFQCSDEEESPPQLFISSTTFSIVMFAAAHSLFSVCCARAN